MLAALAAIKTFFSTYWLYIIIAILVVGAILGIYYKGRSDKANEIALENAKQIIEIKEKIRDIEIYSNKAANEARAKDELIGAALDNILIVAKKRQVVTINPETKECAPTSEFAKTWNELNGVVK